MAFALRATEKVSLVNDEEELRKRGYKVLSTLGEGSYAKVKCAFSQSLGKKIALKIINRKKAPKDFQQKFLPRELEVMKLIDHQNIIRLYEIMQFGGKVYIAMEMAGHGDLLEYIKLRGAIDETKARNMFRQLLSAVEYLHSIGVVHRDLKCENILLDAQNNIKVSDFGFSRLLGKDDLSKTFCGSAAYAAPEILQGIPYKGVCYDIWSLGVILYIMVCGSMPYDDSNIKKMIKTQLEKKVGFSRSKQLSDKVKSLIHCMLEADIPRRYSIPAIKMHPWMQVFEPVTSPPVSSSVGQGLAAQKPRIPPAGPSAVPQGIADRVRPTHSPPRGQTRDVQTAKPRTDPAQSRTQTPVCPGHTRNLPTLVQNKLTPKRVKTPASPGNTPPQMNSDDSLANTLTVKAVIPSTHKTTTTATAAGNSSGSREAHVPPRDKHSTPKDNSQSYREKPQENHKNPINLSKL